MQPDRLFLNLVPQLVNRSFFAVINLAGGFQVLRRMVERDCIADFLAKAGNQLIAGQICSA